MKRFGCATPSRAQQGVTLLISMIFLVVLTLIVMSAIKVTNINTRLVGNTQTQNEADAAAQQALEAVISYDFTAAPPPASTTTLDINGSGQAGSTYSVTVNQPKCIGIKPIKLSELDVTNPNDQPCFASGAVQNAGVVGSGATGASLCSNSNWEINATAASPNGAAPAPTVHQGVAVRVPVGTAC